MQNSAAIDMDRQPVRKKRKKSLTGYSVAVFLLFIISMYHWIGWNGRAPLFYVLSVIIMLCSIKKEHVVMDFSKRKVIPCLVLYVSHLIVNLNWHGDILATAIYTNTLTVLFPLMLMVCISSSDKRIVQENVSKWFSWLLIPALFIYALTLFIDLPSLGITRFSSSETFSNPTYGIDNNYFFLMTPTGSDGFSRFRGPFLEPGHLGMMSALLLFINHHDYKKRYNVVVLISLILSFSLAGYVLWVIGFFMIRYAQNRIKLKTLLLFSAVLGVIFAFSQLYNGGDNILNEMIFSRLEYDEDTGFSGNNRSGVKTALLYANMISNPKLMLHGYSASELAYLDGEAANGLKYLIIRKGLIGMLLCLAYYVCLLFISKNKKIAVLSFIFIFLMFVQRTYSFWFCWIMCYDYMIDIPFYARIRKKKLKHRLKRVCVQ